MRHRNSSLRVGQSCARQEIEGLYSACVLLCVTLFPNAFSSWVHDSDSHLFQTPQWVLPKCASVTADKDGRSIILKYWQGGSETDSGKGQLTVNVCQGTFSSQQSGFLVRCLMLMGIVGYFQPFLIISSLQKRQRLVFNLCFAHSKNPQPETF